MKKAVVRLLAAMLVLSVLLPAAAGAEATDRRGLVEFVELFSRRAVEYERDYDDDIPLYLKSYHYEQPRTTDEGYLILYSDAGEISVDTPDYSVFSVSISFPSKADDEATTLRKLATAAIAVSALEFSNLQNTSLQLSGNSALDKGMDVLFDIYSDWDTNIRFSVRDGSKIKAYSGNYDYYFEYYKTELGSFVFLVAEARK